MFTSRQVTADGLEKTFALNHMSYFTMTNALLPKLKAVGARIVSTASDAHKGNKLNFDDLQSEKSYSSFGHLRKIEAPQHPCSYVRAGARRITPAPASRRTDCLHPGFVATRFGHEGGGFLSSLIKIGQNFALTPEQGAQTIIYLASSPDVEGQSGGYYVKSHLATPTREAQNDADAKRLWDISAKIAGVGL